MRHITNYLPLAAAICASTAGAGGFDNSGQPFDIILGSDSEISASAIMTTATIEGTANSKASGGVNTVDGDITDIYNDPTSTELGVRFRLTNHVNCAVQIDEPYQTNTAMADDALNYFDASSSTPILNAADDSEDTPIATKVDSNAITLGCGYGFELGKSKLTVFAGPKLEKIEAFFSADMFNASASSILGAELSTGDNDNLNYDMSTNYDLGYVVGVGYEIEEYAVKINLAYHAPVEHEFDGTVTAGAGFSAATGRPSSDTVTTKIDTPAAVNLNLQSGFMPGWLAFANLRWANWSDLEGLPVTSSTGNFDVNLGLFSSDTLDYSVGIGHEFNEQLAMLVSFSGVTKLDDDDLASGVDGDSLRQPTGDNYSFGVGGRFVMNEHVSINGGIGYTVVEEFTIDNGSYRVDFDSSHAISFVGGLDVNF